MDMMSATTYHGYLSQPDIPPGQFGRNCGPSKLDWKLGSAAVMSILSVGPEVDNGNSGIHIEFRQCSRNGTNLADTAGFEISPEPELLPEAF
jgi:hypothetical protein